MTVYQSEGGGGGEWGGGGGGVESGEEGIYSPA